MKPLAENRRAHHKYEILETLEAGLVLQGWEVKAIRAGQVQIGEAHIVLTRGEFFLINCHITPLATASTHITPQPQRSRKLLLHHQQIERLIGKVREKGLTLIPLNLHLLRGKVKAEIALARGKKQHDKRRTIQEREWKRQQGRLLRGKSGKGKK